MNLFASVATPLVMLIEDERLVDEFLAIRCQLGEPEAFDELVARWHEPLWKYLRRLTSDDDAAAESVQDVWLRVLRGIPRLRDATRLRPWIFGIARRVFMDRLRAQYAELALVSADNIDLAEPDSSSELEEQLFLLHDELERMPVTEREVLVLFYLKELTLIEIAEVLNVPAGTVKSRLFRARNMLRNQVDKGAKQ